MSALNHSQEFREQGYTIARGFFAQPEIDALLQAIENAQPKSGGPSGLNKGDLVFHSNIFFRSKELQAFISQPQLIRFLRETIGPDFWVRWDQAVAKGPGAGEFPWHQDNAYNQLQDQHYQLWIALNKMNAERGGLWLLPGSHKDGLLPHKNIRNHLVYVGPTDNAVSIEAEAGDIVLFSSLMLHYTSPNVSPYDRLAYVVEYMSLDHFDPFISPPYFVVARNGEPHPEFVHFYRGRLRLANQLKYVMPRVKRGVGRAKTLARRRLEKIFGNKAQPLR